MNQLYYNTQASPEDCADNLRHQNVIEYLATGRVDSMPYLAPKGGESQQLKATRSFRAAIFARMWKPACGLHGVPGWMS